MSIRKKELCDSCRKEKIEPGNEGVYLGDYRSNKTDRIHVCENCYDEKEQEYLTDYDFIYSYSKKHWTRDTGYIKNENAPCYAGKQDRNGNILRQDNCSHCQPWKNHENNKEHHHQKDFPYRQIGFCMKCNNKYEDTKVLYYTPTPNQDKNELDWFCLDCWKSEEKHYRHKSFPKNTAYKLDRRKGKAQIVGGYYYFKNNQWINSDGEIPDPDLEQKNVWRELSAQEALNDPWFSKEIDKLFGSNSQQHENNSTALIKNPTSTEQKSFGNLVNRFEGKTIKRIALTSEKGLMVEYVLPPEGKVSEHTVWAVIDSAEIVNSSELNTVRNYFEKNNKSVLNQHNLYNLLNNNSSIPSDNLNNNLGRNLVLGTSAVLIIGLIIGLLVKGKKIKKH